eukprot:2931358-Pyramimonas_sp.AAC.2
MPPRPHCTPTLQRRMQGAGETERTANRITWNHQAERKESTDEGFEGIYEEAGVRWTPSGPPLDPLWTPFGPPLDPMGAWLTGAGRVLGDLGGVVSDNLQRNRPIRKRKKSQNKALSSPSTFRVKTSLCSTLETQFRLNHDAGERVAA